MFKIKSYKQNTHPPKTTTAHNTSHRSPILTDIHPLNFQHKNSPISNKSSHPISTRLKQQNINKSNNYNSSQNINIFYQNINIKQINFIQNNTIKLLQGLAFGKKYNQKQLTLLTSQFITINIPSTSNIRNNQSSHHHIIKINVYTFYMYYLQFHYNRLQNTKLKGNLSNKLIKPFLLLLSKITKDTPLTTPNHLPQSHHSIKQQIFQIFYQYQPKQQLCKQLSLSYSKYQHLYEDMYHKYQSIPFQQDNIVHELESQNSINDNNIIHQNISNVQNYTSGFGSTTTKQSNTDMKILENEILIQKCKQNQKQNKKDKLQDIIKKQLKKLSDDAYLILKTRIQ